MVLFNNRNISEVETLFNLSKGNSKQLFSFDKIADLPEPVQKYFRFALAKRHNYTYILSTKFEGQFRLKETQQWSSIDGMDYYSVNCPGFIWFAKIKMSSLFWVTVKDCYLRDKGELLVKVYSLFTVASAKGSEIDQGELSRWLSSAVLFPEALLPNENLTWEPINDHSARLIFSYKDIKIDAVVYFGRSGEIVQFVTDRYCSETNQFEKWTAYYKSYADYSGRKIPTEVGAVWNFPAKNFNYARFCFTNIDFATEPK